MIAKSFATAGMHLSPLSILMVLMQLAGTVVARPFPQVPLDTRSTAGYTAEEHERPLERVAVVVICVVLAFALALAQGYRAGRMAGQKSKTRVSDILVFVQGFFCTGFLFAVAIQAAGLGLQTYKQCYIGVRVCIVGYAITKMALYLFLFERVHIVRAPFVDRKHDRIYVVGGLLTTVGFLSILGWEFVNPMAEISPVDGRCRLGIEHDAAIAIIVIDTLINFILTGIFVWQLGPAVTPRLPQVQTTTSTLNKANDANAKGLKAWMKRVHKKIWGFSLSDLQIMVLRNVVGSILTLTFTLANNGLFLAHDFTKVGHTCMLICLADVALGMLVTQWLTMRPVVQEPSSSYHSSIAMPPSTGPATRSNSAISGRPLLNSGGPVTESTVYEIPPPVDCVKNAASRFNVP